MSDNNRSKYLFFEKFTREFFENLHEGDFFDINRMYSDLTNDMKKIFLGTLSICENESFLFETTKIKILNVLKNILIDVHKAKSKKFR